MTDLDPAIRAAAEASARELWRIGNERIGFREWDAVKDHYLAEGLAAVEAAAPLLAAAPTLVDFDGRHFRHGYVLAWTENDPRPGVVRIRWRELLVVEKAGEK